MNIDALHRPRCEAFKGNCRVVGERRIAQRWRQVNLDGQESGSICLRVCRRVAVIRIDWPAGKWLALMEGIVLCWRLRIEGQRP